MGTNIRTWVALCGVMALPSWAQVTSYDAATSMVTIPSVGVGAATFVNVTLRNRGEFVFDLTGAEEQKPAAPGVASYNADTGVLTMPAVKVGSATYLDVKLLNIGNFVFTLQAATELPASVSAELSTFATKFDQLLATAVPATGALRYSLADGCFRANGRTRAYNVAEWDADVATNQLRDAYQIGRRMSNIQVLALRTSVNADVNARREIDVQYDVNFRDGAITRGERATLVSGSSAGTPGCTTPQSGPELRALGNQQLIQTAVRAVNWRDERYLQASGASASPAVNYRREVQFQITDPIGNANYVIVSGPGPTRVVNGTTIAFSMKLLSPRVARSAPEMLGKSGNFLNWLDDDSFRACRTTDSGTNPPVALVADCGALGTTQGNTWGWTTSTPNAAADDGFAAQGWVAGGVYRFEVYDDDGWKFVNGHAGKTPIATYFATLPRLPYTFAEMTGKYPLLNLGGMTPAQIATNANSATPAAMALSWTLPAVLSDGLVHHLFQVWEFHQGAKTGNAGGAFNPAYRTLTRAYPGTTASSTNAFPVTAKLADQANKSYTEFSLFFSDPSNFDQIQSRISFQ